MKKSFCYCSTSHERIKLTLVDSTSLEECLEKSLNAIGDVLQQEMKIEKRWKIGCKIVTLECYGASRQVTKKGKFLSFMVQ